MASRGDSVAVGDLTSVGSCFLCGSTGGPIRMEEGGYVGRACDCGVIYVDPQPAPTAVVPTSDAHLEAYYALPARRRFEWATGFVPSGRFLEVGCGSGQLAGLALERGFEVVAIEPNAACADFVRRRYGIEVEEALVEDTELPDASIDLSFHVDLLSHFPDPVRALEAMARLLRPDGVLCFEVGLFAGLDPRWYPWVGRPHFPAHRWFYDEGGLERTLDRAGLELLDLRSFSIAPSTLMSSSLRKLLPERIESVPAGTDERDELPARGGTVQRAYARTHYLLRYHLGAAVDLPGPRTAFVAARRIGAGR